MKWEIMKRQLLINKKIIALYFSKKEKRPALVFTSFGGIQQITLSYSMEEVRLFMHRQDGNASMQMAMLHAGWQCFNLESTQADGRLHTVGRLVSPKLDMTRQARQILHIARRRSLDQC